MTAPHTVVTEAMVEAAARKMCRLKHGDPDRLEPGDLPHIEGYNRKGEPCHRHWRDFADDAQDIIEAALAVSAGVGASEVVELRANLSMSEQRFATLKAAYDHERRRNQKPIFGSSGDADEEFAQAYYLVTGESPKWAGEFGYAEALAEIRDKMEGYRSALSIAPVSPQPVAWQRLEHPSRPAEADYEVGQLQMRLKQQPDAPSAMLRAFALTQPSQGSFAGALWALAEWAETLPAHPDAEAEQRGRLAGIEEAAKVADGYGRDDGDRAARGYWTDGERARRNTGLDIAREIRALAQPQESSL